MSTIALRRLLPPEHGAWGFLAAGVVTGLVVAPSGAGLLITLGVVLGLVARHAGQLALTGLAIWPVALVLGLASLAAWTLAVLATPTALPWLGGAIVITLLQLAGEAGDRRHGTAGVLEGGLALALVGGAVATAGGADLRTALVVAGTVAGYLLGCIPLVRARRKPGTGWWKDALVGYTAATVVAGCAAAFLGTPWLVAGAFAGLTVRCALVARQGRAATPKAIGLAEIPPLILLVAATALGLRGGW